ncbi:ribose-5-phosphate isomerase RpiA [Deminuibacter soli]|uniref:Ribose-5-phosphate isomerase A n=1 Tax=Deminuibacter soli TaxID=2291815 RepID=A0A3E1NR14_9BACT|nr:ribose-5-phosphate isomerase RpiA [Deminuibacter soli]RFM30363.1 ribose-5-phosphate isomerase RpiA [Deminuibacter soli]
MFNAEDTKKRVGAYAADFIENGMTVGLGTGSTVYWLLQTLGERVQQGLQFSAVPTSRQTQTLATELGITLTELNAVNELVLTIDGADEVDARLQLIKGGGGALLQEKMVAAASKQLIIIVDENKMVDTLGKFPLPVEVIPSGWKQVHRKVMGMGCTKAAIRQKNEQAFITDNGHYILDCYFEQITDPVNLNIALHLVPGVVETGLFNGMADMVITGHSDGRIDTKSR